MLPAAHSCHCTGLRTGQASPLLPMTVSASNGLALVAIAIGLAAVALVWFRGRLSRTSLALAVVIGATASSLDFARALTVHRSVQSRAHLLEAIPEHPLPDDEFVTSATCKACHPAQYATWHASYHRTMTPPARARLSTLPSTRPGMPRITGP